MQFSPGTEDRPCLKAGTQATNRSTETIRRNPLWGEEKFWKSRIQAYFSRIGMNAVLLRTKPIIIRFKRALSRLMYKKMYCDKIESYDYDGQLLHPWQRSFPTWNSAIQGTCFSSIVPKGGRERTFLWFELSSVCLLAYLNLKIMRRVCTGSGVIVVLVECSYIRMPWEYVVYFIYWKLCRLILYHKKNSKHKKLVLNHY